MKTAKLLRTLKGFSGSQLGGLTFAPDGTRLIASGGHVPTNFWTSPDQPYSELRPWDVLHPGAVRLQGRQRSHPSSSPSRPTATDNILSQGLWTAPVLCLWDTEYRDDLFRFSRPASFRCLRPASRCKSGIVVWIGGGSRRHYLRLESGGVHVGFSGSPDRAVSACGNQTACFGISRQGEIIQELEGTR